MSEKKMKGSKTLLIQEVDHVYSQLISGSYKTIAVTSSTKGEGTSTIVRALALRCVAAGRNTLIVDLNIDHPSIASIKPKETKAYYLESGYGVIGFSHKDPLLIRLREPGELGNKLTEWKDVYDSIIIDTAPLNTVSRLCFPAERICASSDATIMLVLSAHTTQAQVVEAVEKLKVHKANLVGTILNDYYNPDLKAELLRTSGKFARVFPGASRWVNKKLYQSRFLSLEV